MKRVMFTDLQGSVPGRELERLEIIRARLRVAPRLGPPEIKALLEDCARLRADLLLRDREPSVSEGVATSAARDGCSGGSLGFEGVLGESPRLLEALEIVRRAAPTTLPILIEGESGTGKELFAKVVHANSKRRDAPFISINCGAIPENLLESELFGHRQGAFTGASADRKGLFEAAEGGTVFLDEVGELPLTGQVKLLRVLQSNEVQRVGSDRPVAVDTRIVAATNRDLAAMVEEGTYREDLFYRLSVIQALLPPLRERRDEIALLCDFFIGQASVELGRPRIVLSPPLQRLLERYQYPGNIRELRNIIFRLACLCDGEADVDDLPAAVRDALQSSDAVADAHPLPAAVLTRTLGEVRREASDAAEKRYLERGLQRTRGSVLELARELKMNRSHLQTLLRKHGLRSKAFRPRAD